MATNNKWANTDVLPQFCAFKDKGIQRQRMQPNETRRQWRDRGERLQW